MAVVGTIGFIEFLTEVSAILSEMSAGIATTTETVAAAGEVEGAAIEMVSLTADASSVFGEAGVGAETTFGAAETFGSIAGEPAEAASLTVESVDASLSAASTASTATEAASTEAAATEDATTLGQATEAVGGGGEEIEMETFADTTIKTPFSSTPLPPASTPGQLFQVDLSVIEEGEISETSLFGPTAGSSTATRTVGTTIARSILNRSKTILGISALAGGTAATATGVTLSILGGGGVVGGVAAAAGTSLLMNVFIALKGSHF